MSRTIYLRVKVLIFIPKPIQLHTLYMSDMSNNSSINLSISSLFELSLSDPFLEIDIRMLGFLVLPNTLGSRLLPYTNATAFSKF